MKNTRVGAIIVLLVILALGVVFYRQKNSPPLSITSTDGQAKLTLAPKALPPGAEVSSLKITILPAESGDLTYQLEPDSLSLNEPTKLEITLESSAETVPIISHYSATGSVPLDDVTVSRNDATNTAAISASLSHFSYLTIMSGIFRFNLDTPEVVSVGEPFTVTISGEHTGQASAVTLDSGTTVTQTLLDPWTIEGKMTVSDHFRTILNPQKVENLPALTQKQGRDQRFSHNAQFTCTAPQKSLFITSYLTLGGSFKKTFTYSEAQAKDLGTPGFTDIKPFSHNFEVFSDAFDCVAKTAPTPKSKPQKPDQSQSSNLAPLEVLVINGKFFPANQFNQAGADTGCSSSHYHAAYEVSDIDLGTHLSDPNPSGCGFGTTDAVPRRTEMLPKEKVELF